MPYFVLHDGKQLHRVSASLYPREDDILLKFGFNDAIKDEIKVMCDRPRWSPTDKAWLVKNTHRTRFALEFLQGKNVFERYDAPLIQIETDRKEPYHHQLQIASHIVTRRQCGVAAEMGSGKTLSAILALEYLKQKLGHFEAWYVAPKTALLSVKLDFAKWKARYYPQFMTLQEMVKICSNWPTGKHPPRIVFFDESSRLKSPDAKQSQCALHLANAIRDHWGDEGYIILMSGSPAPKSPLDWWMQCEIARPGFLREGHPCKFLDRVALVKKMVGESGIAWPKVLSFKDDVRKCNACARFKEHEVHQVDMFSLLTQNPGQDLENQLHKFEPMVNEVEKMYARLNGLWMVVLKKDCLDLPEKVYRRVQLKPTKYMLNLAKMTRKTAGTAANALNLLRQLSDGFQYHQELVGTVPCTHCVDLQTGKPTGKQTNIVDTEENGHRLEESPCIHCAGKKEYKKYKETVVRVDSPKDQALTDILEEKEEDGRIVIFASYQGAIDRVCEVVVKAGWHFARRDGRGWHTDLGIDDPASIIRQFQREEPSQYEKIAIIGHPKSLGMGVTLTASDTEVYYDNSFDAEDRIQSEDRIHRPGCRGANIIDLCHLEIDNYVLDMVAKKRNMQSVTMGEIDRVMEAAENDPSSS
jgi:hypothetical protein